MATKAKTTTDVLVCKLGLIDADQLLNYRRIS